MTLQAQKGEVGGGCIDVLPIRSDSWRNYVSVPLQELLETVAPLNFRGRDDASN
jgi:hypothetical protein